MTRISAPASRARCAKSPVPSRLGWPSHSRRMRGECGDAIATAYSINQALSNAKGMSARVIVEALQIELSHDTLPGNST